MSYPDARYLAEKGEVSAVFRGADAVPELAIGGRTNVHYLATGATTDGHFGLYRWEMGQQPSGSGAHFHRTFSESFFILDGRVNLFNGDAWTTASPGDFLYAPPGGVHAFRNEDGPATMLVLFAPGAPREAYFEELAEIVESGRELSEEEWAEIYLRHDQFMV
ncbi:cupin domain-containing protein [Actinomadura rupiterrae]|uniref:cupin domain-containing protein n=1 Tax=Actinomadura rupiterrae TaxID=559627 RepID=UPI0020A4763A|nr:cupin domain-containing protein [Actinomadura rupiterrae]MCP2340699.1 quercetin dioxygenase-like cupin family protein [Actinomadura rupiterrae]